MAVTKIDPFDLEAALAAEDLSAWQHKLVKLNENGELVKCGAGETGFVLQDKPIKGQVGTYAVEGRVKAIAGGAIKAGVPLSSSAGGTVVEATATVINEEKVETLGTRIVGYSLEKVAEGELFAYRAVPIAPRA